MGGIKKPQVIKENKAKFAQKTAALKALDFLCYKE